MQWKAQYNDGSILPQYTETGIENKYADIDRNKLVAFSLLTDEHLPVFTLHLEPDQKLIYRRRVEQRPTDEKFVVFLVGWQMNVSGRNIQSIAYITELGEVHMAGAWKEDHPWFYSIQPVPCEE